MKSPERPARSPATWRYKVMESSGHVVRAGIKTFASAETLARSISGATVRPYRPKGQWCVRDTRAPEGKPARRRVAGGFASSKAASRYIWNVLGMIDPKGVTGGHYAIDTEADIGPVPLVGATPITAITPKGERVMIFKWSRYLVSNTPSKVAARYKVHLTGDGEAMQVRPNAEDLRARNLLNRAKRVQGSK